MSQLLPYKFLQSDEQSSNIFLSEPGRVVTEHDLNTTGILFVCFFLCLNLT